MPQMTSVAAQSPMTTRWPLSDGPFPGSGSGLGRIVQRHQLTYPAEVLRSHTRKIRVADPSAMLRRLAPSWHPYRDLTGVGLRELLDAQGVRTTNTANVRELDPAELHCVTQQEAS
jgi:hypothetical protein